MLILVLLQVGVGQVIKGWDEGIVTMKSNELCVLRCSPEYEYGERYLSPKPLIPRCTKGT